MFQHTFLEHQTYCHNSNNNHFEILKLRGIGSPEWRKYFYNFQIALKKFLYLWWFISIYIVLDKLSEYIYFYISKKIFHTYFFLSILCFFSSKLRNTFNVYLKVHSKVWENFWHLKALEKRWKMLFFTFKAFFVLKIFNFWFDFLVM